MDKNALNYDTVKRAVKEGGSGRQAAKLIGKSYTALQWWLARNGYRVEHTAKLVKVTQKEQKE